MPRIVEDTVREYVARKMGLEETIIEASDFDVDAYLLRFSKPQLAIEVKWKGKIDKEDIRKAEENLARIKADEKWLFVPDKLAVTQTTTLKLVDITDLLK